MKIILTDETEIFGEGVLHFSTAALERLYQDIKDAHFKDMKSAQHPSGEHQPCPEGEHDFKEGRYCTKCGQPPF